VFRGNSTRRKVKVEEIIIADAEGLEDYDYACWTNTTAGGAKIKLEAKYNAFGRNIKSLSVWNKINGDM